MSENVGLHVQLTADAGGFTQTINNAKSKLVDLAEQAKILKQGEKDIAKELENAKKKYGENSKKVAELTVRLVENAGAQKEVKLEIDEVNKTLRKANKELKNYADNASKGFKEAADSSANAAETIKSGFNMIKGLIVGYAGKKLYEALIGTNAEYEQSMTSFEVLLQSADKANSMMKKLETMGAATPFETSDLMKATTQLLAFGTAEEDVTQKLQQLGDLSIGNAEKLDRLTNAYGKMLAKGKVSLEELNMFTEAGVPILKELQKQYDVSQEDFFKMISAGEIGINQINAAMQSMTSEGGQFFGMMEKQAQTFEGMMSTISDNVNIFARSVGEEAFSYLKTELSGLLETIDEMSASGQLDSLAKELGSGIANAVTFIADLVKWLYEMKDTIIASGAAVITYKTSFALLTAAVTKFNAVKELFNIITGKSVVCKNLETGATYTLTAAEAAEVTAKNEAIVAQSTFNAVCNANPYVMVASLILGVVSALTVYNAVTGESSDKTRELIDESKRLCDEASNLQGEFEKNTTKIELNTQRASELIDELYSLEAQLQSGTLTTAEATAAKNDMAAALDELNRLCPELELSINSETGALSIQRGEVEKLVNAYFQLARAKAYAQQIEKIEAKRLELEVENVNLEKQRSNAMPSNLTFEKYGKFLNKTSVSPADVLTGRLSQASTVVNVNKQIDANNKAIADLDAKQEAVMDIIKSDKIDLGLLNGGDKTPPKNVTPSGGGNYSGGTRSNPGGGSTRQDNSAEKAKREVEKAAKEAEKQRAAAVKAEMDAFEERERLDERSYNLKKQYGKLDSKEELQSIKDRAERYRDFAESILTMENATEEEKLSYIKKYSEKAEDIELEAYKKRKDIYNERFEDSMDYINDNDHYGRWEELNDDKFKAIRRIMDYTDEARQKDIISAEEYKTKMSSLYEMLESEIKTIIESEQDHIKEKYQKELEVKKAALEASLNMKKAEFEAERNYLDEIVQKRKELKEDDDYATRMQRLKNKLEYETDEGNKKALQKEIEKLQGEIDDTNFNRDIEQRRKQLEADEKYESEKAQRRIDSVTKYYEDKMSGVNIAAEISKNINLGEFAAIGEKIGLEMSSGITSAIDNMVKTAMQRLNEISGAASNVVNKNRLFTFNQTNNITGDISPAKLRDSAMSMLRNAGLWRY